jgi:YfiH family protein
MPTSKPQWIVPNWSAPSNVLACVTTRNGGVSQGPYHSLNLGDHVGDDPHSVAQNRALLQEELALPSAPVWLEQVHGTGIIELPYAGPRPPQADGSFSRAVGEVCTVMTADCLPVLLCDKQGTVVAAAHAGWRGLAAGVIEKTIAAMAVAPDSLLAWLGPAIGPQAFEVGEDVVQAFVADNKDARLAFQQTSQDRWLADIYQLARLRLGTMGVGNISGGEFCTFQDSDRFYSFRRDKLTGRMASLIWLTD